MKPGDEIESIEHLRPDLVAVHVRNGQQRRTVLLKDFGGGDWGAAIENPYETTKD
jgi:hypothetical protein